MESSFMNESWSADLASIYWTRLVSDLLRQSQLLIRLVWLLGPCSLFYSAISRFAWARGCWRVTSWRVCTNNKESGTLQDWQFPLLHSPLLLFTAENIMKFSRKTVTWWPLWSPLLFGIFSQPKANKNRKATHSLFWWRCMSLSPSHWRISHRNAPNTWGN